MNVDSVLLITPHWTTVGGVAAHTAASATALAEHGLNVSVLTARIDAAAPPGVTLFESRLLFDESASPAARLGEALASPPTTIHAHQFNDPDVIGYLQAGAPVVLSAHGYTACTSGVHYFRPGHECTRPHGSGCVPNVLFRGCAHTRHVRSWPASFRRTTRAVEGLRRADLAVSYSSVVDFHLATNGVVRRKVIPLFTTIAPATATGHVTRRRIVFAGRVVAPKGIGVLIRAARLLDAEIVVCGDGFGLDAMQRLARRLGVDQRVRFTGWLAPEALARELAEASIVVMPSLWPEPFGLVGIEALAAGRPVVASATGGVGDWLEDGVSGLCVKPGDPHALARALNELLDDPARQQSMGAAGRRTVAARFSARHHVSALLEGYRIARSTWEASRGDAARTARPLVRTAEAS